MREHQVNAVNGVGWNVEFFNDYEWIVHSVTPWPSREAAQWYLDNVLATAKRSNYRVYEALEEK